MRRARTWPWRAPRRTRNGVSLGARPSLRCAQGRLWPLGTPGRPGWPRSQGCADIGLVRDDGGDADAGELAILVDHPDLALVGVGAAGGDPPTQGDLVAGPDRADA